MAIYPINTDVNPFPLTVPDAAGTGFVNSGVESFTLDGSASALVTMATPMTSDIYGVMMAAGRPAGAAAGESITPNYRIVSATQFWIDLNAPFDGRVSWGAFNV